VNHSIPDALAIAVHTGAGTILHTGDIKIDQLPLDGRPTDLPGMLRLGEAGVHLFLCDSTNSAHPGVSPSESEVGPPLHRLIRGAEGRVIVACFASNVDRVQQIIDAAVALGRRVTFVGGRWCATWASPGNSASCGWPTRTSSTSRPPR
jgi:ribonuclease J